LFLVFFLTHHLHLFQLLFLNDQKQQQLLLLLLLVVVVAVVVVELLYILQQMQKLDETDTTVTNSSLLTKQTSQQPGGMASSLPRHLNDVKNTNNKRLSRHTDAATSCEEILMTVHTNKGIITSSLALAF